MKASCWALALHLLNDMEIYLLQSNIIVYNSVARFAKCWSSYYLRNDDDDDDDVVVVVVVAVVVVVVWRIKQP